MNMYQKFQEAIKNGNLKEALLIVFSNSLQFKISTSVVSSEENQLHSYSSTLNLLKGLETEISSTLLNDEYKTINEFHEKQVNQADEIWQENRETLIKIFEILSGIPRQQDLQEGNNLNLSEGEAGEDFVSQMDDFISDLSPNSDESEYLDNQNEETFELVLEEEKKEVEEFSEESNLDNFPVDNVRENEAEILNLETENIDSKDVLEEDWKDIFEDVNESEKIDKKPSEASPSVQIEAEDDWEKWINDDDKKTNSSEANLEEFDWEDEENWEEFNPNIPVENMTENK